MLVIVFQAGVGRYGIEARRVSAVLPQPRLTEIPTAPPAVSGLMTYGARVVPVVDVTAMLTGEVSKPVMSTRILVVEAAFQRGEKRLIGLLVEHATEAVNCDEKAVRSSGLRMGGPLAGDVWEIEGQVVQRVTPEGLLTPEIRRLMETEEVASDGNA